MRKFIKILILIIAIPLVLLLIFISVYLITNIQGVIEPYQLGNPHAKHKVLIASQGSEFKSLLVEEITQRIQSDSIFISVLDCTSLDVENSDTWDATVIIHTTQIHGMPEEARSYLSRSDDLSKVALVSTSGGGDEVVTEFEVDAISCASHLSLTDTLAKWTISRLDHILAKNRDGQAGEEH